MTTDELNQRWLESEEYFDAVTVRAAAHEAANDDYRATYEKWMEAHKEDAP